MERKVVLRKKSNACGSKFESVVEQGRLIETDASNLFLFRGMYKILQSHYDKFQQ